MIMVEPRAELHDLWIKYRRIQDHISRTYDKHVPYLCIEFNPDHGKRWIKKNSEGEFVLGSFGSMTAAEARRKAVNLKPPEPEPEPEPKPRPKRKKMKRKPTKRVREACHSLVRYPKPPQDPAVYFLLQNNEIVYVGVAKNVGQRVPCHHQKEYDSWCWVPNAEGLEEACIHYLGPKYNIQRFSDREPTEWMMDILKELVPWILKG